MIGEMCSRAALVAFANWLACSLRFAKKNVDPVLNPVRMVFSRDSGPRCLRPSRRSGTSIRRAVGSASCPSQLTTSRLASADVLLRLAKRHEAEAANLRRMESELSAQVVPLAVHIGIEAVRLSGLTNMLDRSRVAEIADEMGFPEAAEWVRENPEHLYARAIFHGIACASE